VLSDSPLVEEGIHEGRFTSFEKGKQPMTRYPTHLVIAVAAVFALLTATMLPVQPVFGSGAARRDAVHAEAQHRQDAITRAKDAVAHGQQGHAEAVVTNADAALQHALKAGEDAHVDAGITELKQAIEHGKAGYADVATKHAEQAVTHLSERK
jgi:hypothetical protein